MIIQSARAISSKGSTTVTRTQNGPLIALFIVLSIVFCEIAGGISSDEGDLDTISHFSRLSVVNSGEKRTKSATAEKQNNSTGRNISTLAEDEVVEEKPQGKFHGNGSTSAHTNNISDYIRNGELSAIFCERCTDSQKEKVEQILYLLYNFNNNAAAGGAGIPSSVNSDLNSSQVKQYISQSVEPDKGYVLLKKKKYKFKATSSPVPVYRKNLPEMMPTPETVMSSYHHNRQLNRVVQLPPSTFTLSSTTPATISPGYSSMAIPIVPYFYSSSVTSPLPSSSTTVSSALEPVQSVEMPTPPMPPTTTGPIYLYYLGGSGSTSSSSSLETPSTPVMESSVAYASRPTTMEPML